MRTCPECGLQYETIPGCNPRATCSDRCRVERRNRMQRTRDERKRWCEHCDQLVSLTKRGLLMRHPDAVPHRYIDQFGWECIRPCPGSLQPGTDHQPPQLTKLAEDRAWYDAELRGVAHA